MVRKIFRKLGRLFISIGTKPDKLDAFYNSPRYQPGEYVNQGKLLQFPDAASFASIYKEVFNNEIYKFNTKLDEVYILDCGANIGLSVIYLKSLFPNAEIVAFEPDKEIFSYLQNNINRYNFIKVTLLNLGVWKENGVITFKNEGADAGRIAFGYDDVDFKLSEQIQVVKLSDYINKKVSFLKMDIEGSELEVLQEIENKLHYVEQIFIEFHSFENNNQSLDIILSILSRNNFRYYLDTPSHLREKPFIDKTVFLSFDFLTNIYAISETFNV